MRRLVLGGQVLLLLCLISTAARAAEADEAASDLDEFDSVLADFDFSVEQRLQAYQRMQREAEEGGDAATAEKYARQIVRRCGDEKEFGDAALWQLSRFYTRQRQLDKSRDLLKELVATGRQNRYTALAHLGLSEMYHAADDEAAMLRHLELAAEAPRVPTNRGSMDTQHSRQTALQRLGKHYQSRGEHATALAYFTRWEPCGECGTCVAHAAYERHLHIAQCQVSLGRVDEALDKYLLPRLAPDGPCLGDARVPTLIVEVFERQGRLDELIEQTRAAAEKNKRDMERITHELAQIRVWRWEEDVTRLITQLRHQGAYVPSVRQPRDNWRAPAAAAALAELGGKEFPALKRRFDRAVADQNDRWETEQIGRRMWALYAIGLSKSPAARQMISDIARRFEDQSYRARDELGVNYDVVRFIASLQKADAEPAVGPKD